MDLADGDLTRREGNRVVVDAALERFGRLDAVVASAGFQHVAPVVEFPEERWDALVAVLLTSPFLLAKYAWDALAASGDGRFLVALTYDLQLGDDKRTASPLGPLPVAFT